MAYGTTSYTTKTYTALNCLRYYNTHKNFEWFTVLQNILNRRFFGEVINKFTKFFEVIKLDTRSRGCTFKGQNLQMTQKIYNCVF